MFGLFRKKRKAIPPQPSPPWVKWALVGFVILALIGNLRKGTPDAPNKVHEAFHQAAENLNPKKFFNLSEYKSALFPAGELRIHDTKEGTGASAACGQEVKIAYAAFIGKDKKIDDSASKEKPLAFRIGDGKAMPAFEQGVIGMKQGGTRSIFSPPGMAYGAKDFARKDVSATAAVRFEVELLEATPALPDLAITPYRIATVVPGSGTPAICGEVAHVRVLIWSIEGKKLYTSKEPVSFTPGKSEVFLGLEQGVIGLAQGGVRTLIVPPPFQKTMNGNPAAVDFPFPENQTVLVDVEIAP